MGPRQNAALREQAALRFAQRGAKPIVGIGFPQAASIDKVARAHPTLRFAIVDAVVELPNVQSFVYREHEASFLAGIAAAMTSKSGKVGMVGGMDVPLVPGTVLTSVLKRVDLAVLQAFKGVEPGVTALGLKEGGVDLAMDEHNANLVTAAMRARLDAASRYRCGPVEGDRLHHGVALCAVARRSG